MSVEHPARTARFQENFFLDVHGRTKLSGIETCALGEIPSSPSWGCGLLPSKTPRQLILLGWPFLCR